MSETFDSFPAAFLLILHRAPADWCRGQDSPAKRARGGKGERKGAEERALSRRAEETEAAEDRSCDTT